MKKLKKYQKGSEIKLPPYPHKKTYAGSPYKSAEDSTIKANKIVELERDFLTKHKAMRTANPNWKVESKEVDAARKRYERDPDVANYRNDSQGKFYSSEDRRTIREKANRPNDNYKKGGVVKKTTMKKQNTSVIKSKKK